MPLKSSIWFSLLLFNCTMPQEPNPISLPVGLDFSETIVVGGSLSAGYRDGGLFQEGMLNSFPNLMAQSLQRAGLTTFTQPLFPVGQENGTGYNRGFLSGTSLQTEVVNQKLAVRSQNPTLYAKTTGLLHQLSVPQMRMIDLGRPNYGNPTWGGFNSLLERMIPVGKESEPFQNLLTGRKVSFFVLDLGWHDVLEYALSGGTKNISDDFAFAVNLQGMMNTFSAQKAKGLILTLPDMTALPYFNRLSLVEAQRLTGVSTLYIATANGVRAATANDLILWKAKNSLISKQVGVNASQPLPNEWVLDANEVATLRQATDMFNLILQKQAKEYQYVTVDLGKLYQSLTAQQYRSSDNTPISATFPSGGFFAADGLYPTARGQAVIANECLQTLNTTFGIQLPLLSLSKYSPIEIR